MIQAVISYSQTDSSRPYLYHFLIWILMTIGLLTIFILVVCVLPFSWKFRKPIYFESHKLLVFVCIGLFLSYVCYYALPTFFFLLVYPTKVIVIASYFISYLFSITLLFAISIDEVFIIILNHKVCGSSKSNPGKLLLLIYFILFFIYPVLSFAIMFDFLYSLVLSRASAITTVPNTLLSLLPSTAISGISWMLRKKFMSTSDESNI